MTLLEFWAYGSLVLFWAGLFLLGALGAWFFLVLAVELIRRAIGADGTPSRAVMARGGSHLPLPSPSPKDMRFRR